MRGRTFSCSLLYPSNYQNVHCGHLLCRPQNIFCQLHYCLAEVVDAGIWLIFFQNLISLIIFCSFCGMNWRFFCTFADRRCRSIHARGCLCVALFNILRCFSSFDRLFSRSMAIIHLLPRNSTCHFPPIFLHCSSTVPPLLHY